MIKELNAGLFWDVRAEELELDTHAAYIIPRVMDYGSWEEVRFLLSYYPEARIKEILVNAPALQKLTINFFHHFYKVPLDQFKSWNKLQNAFWEK